MTLDKLIQDKQNAFHNPTAVSDEEALGLLIASHLDWDSRIIETFVAALEDANFHSLNNVIEKIKDWSPTQLRDLAHRIDVMEGTV